MTGYTSNIEELTLANTFFRSVLYTTNNIQLVLMSLKPNEDIGFEVHEENDQFFRFEKGNGKVVIGNEETLITDGSVVIVPKRINHNIINTSDSEDLKFYTIYGPPHHKDKTVHKTKEEALSS